MSNSDRQSSDDEDKDASLSLASCNDMASESSAHVNPISTVSSGRSREESMRGVPTRDIPARVVTAGGDGQVLQRQHDDQSATETTCRLFFFIGIVIIMWWSVLLENKYVMLKKHKKH